MQNNFKRIVLHWAAGTYKITPHDRHCYHYIINQKGFITNGVHPPEANLDCSNGIYAPHTGGGNTGAIGVALSGMVNFSYPNKHTPFPITPLQLEAAFSFTAKLCKKYGLKITPDTVLTHYEFGLKNPLTSSKGKIDIIYLPTHPEIHKYQVGDFIRDKVRWYLKTSSRL